MAFSTFAGSVAGVDDRGCCMERKCMDFAGPVLLMGCRISLLVRRWFCRYLFMSRSASFLSSALRWVFRIVFALSRWFCWRVIMSFFSVVTLTSLVVVEARVKILSNVFHEAGLVWNLF